jgi:hypothetical protein
MQFKWLSTLCLVGWLAAGCTQPPAAADLPAANIATPVPTGAGAEATIAALSTANIAANATLAALRTPGNAAPAALPVIAAPLERPISRQAPVGGLLFDAARDQLYLGDGGQTLLILNAGTLEESGRITFPAGEVVQVRQLAMGGEWLLVSTYADADKRRSVAVVDIATGALLATLPGAELAIDEANQRLFVGEALGAATPPDAPGVRAYSTADFSLLATGDQPGIPLYNPARNELLIIGYTVYTADPATLAVTGDLFPELEADLPGTLKWCNGCRWAEAGAYHAGLQPLSGGDSPAGGLLHFEMPAHCTGGGCGLREPFVWLDAATLTPITGNVAPALAEGCADGRVTLLSDSAAGQVRNLIFSRYVVYRNVVQDAGPYAVVERWDGVTAAFADPGAQLIYLDNGLIVDSGTFRPVATWPAFCPYAYDEDGRRLFGIYEHDGGQGVRVQPLLPAPAQPLTVAVQPQESGPAEEWFTLALAASPEFAADQLVYATIDGELYRSDDGGSTWRQQVIAPFDPAFDGPLHPAFSPNFAADRTLFFAGENGSGGRGYGVWRSVDGGASVEPLWSGLHHLRTIDFIFSDRFADDGTLLVRSRFNDLYGNLSGESYHRSSDGGVTWQLVTTAPDGDLPAPAAWLPASAAAPLLRLLPGGSGVELATGEGAGQPVVLPLAASEYVVALLDHPLDPQLWYAVAERSLYRTVDGGASWQQLLDERVQALPAGERLLAASLVAGPVPGGGADLLLVGGTTGQLWQMAAATSNWSALATGAAPATEPTATPTPLPAGAVVTLPTPTPVSLPDEGEAPAGFFRPNGLFAERWNASPAVQAQLGFAQSEFQVSTAGALQQFEHGVMFWRQDTSSLYALFNDGNWQSWPDTFVEGQAEFDPALVPPAGRLQPIRGFGKVWRSETGVQEALGWALAQESAADVTFQNFEHGMFVQVKGVVYLLVEEAPGAGSWK